MNKTIKKTIFLISIILFISCGNNKTTIANSNANTNPVSEYINSRKAYSGKLKDYEYKEIIKIIETELNTSIPMGKSVLINYNQKAPNCIYLDFSKEDNSAITNNSIRISSQISSNNNTVDFFIYTNDSYNKDIFEKRKEFILDSGFFYKNVFTEHENCEAFLIIKPKGEFYKYYGEDYYTEVKKLLEKKIKN